MYGPRIRDRNYNNYTSPQICIHNMQINSKIHMFRFAIFSGRGVERNCWPPVVRLAREDRFVESAFLCIRLRVNCRRLPRTHLTTGTLFFKHTVRATLLVEFFLSSEMSQPEIYLCTTLTNVSAGIELWRPSHHFVFDRTSILCLVKSKQNIAS